MVRTTAVCVTILMLTTAVSAQTNVITDTLSKLTTLNNYRYNNVYRYQARCSLPCKGSYKPGDFKVTISLDKICSNFESFGNFKSAQTTRSSVWFLSNTNWISSNSQGMCQFDVQFDHTPQNPVPTGTCEQDWEMPYDCQIDDVNGAVLYGWMTCFNVAAQQLDECYNQTVFSQCCNTCNNNRFTDIEDCPFGDLRPWQCTSLEDFNCYDNSTEQNCCKTCHDKAQDRQPKIEGCRYGDNVPNFCEDIEDYQCYEHARECCETCYWRSEPSQPDCLYGNKKPALCYDLSTYQCYNKTVENDCCGWCNELRNDNNPDCRYGDREPKCNRIERWDCYTPRILDTCCETCVELADNNYPECAYGDSRDCSDISRDECYQGKIDAECCETCRFIQENNCLAQSLDEEYDIDICGGLNSQDCYNEDKRSQCCFTCIEYYKQNTHLSDESCSFGDRRHNCHQIKPWECYKRMTKNACCETCSYLAFHNEEDCKYGNRFPSRCYSINNTECYNGKVENECCETCSYYTLSSLPTYCRYGDKANDCRLRPPYDCYNLNVQDTCCETCAAYDKTDSLGAACRYGDRRDDCYERGNYKCYNADDRRECCRYCQTIEDKDNVGCEFGDKEESCDRIKASECYTREGKCCDTCPTKLSVYNIDNCEYGDRDNCSGISRNDCYDLNTAFMCCETCWLHSNGNTGDCSFGDKSSDCGSISAHECYYRENECCKTCEKLINTATDLSHCKYGDRRVGCSNITADQCYGQNTEYQCCETCFNKRRTDLSDDCIYGDKARSCKSSQFHGSECYIDSREDQCCETCSDLETNDPDCEYGDKDVKCRDVGLFPYFCYNKTVENACCSSCPQLYDTAYPGCEYGDKYEFCESTKCVDYPFFRREDCCLTCWYYNDHSTDITYSTTYPTSSSTDNASPGEKKKQDSSTTTTKVTPTSQSTSDWWWWWGTISRETTLDTNTPLPRSWVTPSVSITTDTSRSRTSSLSRLTSSLSSRSTTLSVSSSRSTTSTLSSRSTTSSTLTYIDRALKHFVGNTLPIVGGVIGGVLVIAIIVIAACFIMRGKSNAEKPTSKFTDLSVGSNTQPPNTSIPSYPSNGQKNGGIGNPGYNSRPEQPKRPPPKRLDSKQDEEVYDYINDSDVRSLPSIKKPSVPDRIDEGGAVYLEPTTDGKAEYFNPTFQNDSSNDYHTYHVLQKDNNVEREYMKL